MSSILTLYCVLIVGVSLLGGLLPLATVLTHTRLQVYLSFSAGSMLGAAFFHMLPEAVRTGTPATIRWAAVGLLGLFFLERFFSFHHHESHDAPGANAHRDLPITVECDHTDGSHGASRPGEHIHLHKRAPASVGRPLVGNGRVRACRPLAGRRSRSRECDRGRLRRAPWGRGHRLGRIPGDRRSQTRGRAHDRQPDVTIRGPQAECPPG